MARDTPARPEAARTLTGRRRAAHRYGRRLSCRARPEGYDLFDFDMLGLAPTLNSALVRAGFTQPTPIQTQAIPLAMEGHDILGLAQTGTGKTLAFGLPLIDHLMAQPGKPAPKTAKALVLAPTRELVNQIAESLRVLTEGSRLRVTTVVGGQSIGKQIALLARGTDILVATPGRLIDLMERGAVDLGQVRHLVLDEADQMLDLGFIHALRRIAPRLGMPRQTMLFSATMPKQMEELSRAYLTNPRRVQVAPPGKVADKVNQSVHFLDKMEKPAKLREILSRDMDALTLVFARTKHGAEKLMKGLVADGYNATSIHGNKSQGQRDRAIKAFREGAVTTLVATDVAARGIDIPGVAYVINYDLPEVPENYVHRIGRTARAGLDGEAIAFCAPEEADLLHQIQKLMKIEVPVASGSSPRPAYGDFGGNRNGVARKRGKMPGGSAAPANRRPIRRRRAA
jgi:ATP-dependent RNA helicase RhlE